MARSRYVALVALASMTTWAQADELLVPSQFRDIQSAIDAATDGDTIIVAPGVYVGRGNANIRPGGKAITIRSTGGAAVTTLDAARNGSVFLVSAIDQPGPIVEGFTIVGANRSGVQVTGGSITLRACVMADNWNGIVGGGVNVDGGGSVTLEGCVLRDNLAGQGAGLNVWEGGRATLRGCLIVGNRADITGGGGVMADQGATLTMDRCIVKANRAIGFAGSSAGVRVARASMGTITNSLIIDNTALGQGGGISFTNDSTGSVVNTTIANNVASFGGGGVLLTDGVVGVEISNTILWDNIPDQVSAGGTRPSMRYSIVMGGYSGEGVLDIDPRFVAPFEDNYELQPGSPAIDAGDNAAAAGLELDLAGLPRFVDDPSTPDTGLGTAPIVDMGAYEFQVDSCPVDFDGDGQLTIFDFLAFQTAFGLGDPRADFDGDGELTIFDFLAFQTAFAQGCE